MMTLALRNRSLTTALGLAALSAVELSGCGFTPLYAAPGVTSKLSGIEVSRPEGRTGYLMGQDLDDQFGKEARVGPPIYRLLLKTREVRIPRGIRVDNVASRYEVQLGTTYTLVDIATRMPITKGFVQVNVTYESADQPYAGVAASSDGERRAADQVAERIHLELASFFASNQKTTVAAASADGATPASDAALNTYSERLQGAIVESPRDRALGQPAAQSAEPGVLGAPLQDVTTDTGGSGPSAPMVDPYSRPNDPAIPPVAPAPGASIAIGPVEP